MTTKERDWIEEMVGALFDPIIAYPSSWMETIPEKMKEDLTLHRLAHLMRCNKGEAAWGEACDLEALIYLYPATLEAPMSSEWTRIYLYLATKYVGDRTPEDIREDTLPDYEMGKLRELKRWLHDRKVKARVERGRAQRREDRETEQAKREAEQSALFAF